MIDRQEEITKIDLGEEARKFVESDLGRFVLGLAKMEVDSAKDDLLKVDPQDEKKIRDLQNKARLGNQFEQWLCEIITDGDQSLATLAKEQEEN